MDSEDIVFLLMLVLYFPVFAVTIVLFYKRRGLQPIKARAPLLLIVASVGGCVMFVRLAMEIILPPAHDIGCDLYRWLTNVSFALFVFPYLLRCVILYLIFHVNMNTLAIGTLTPIYTQDVWLQEHQDYDVDLGVGVGMGTNTNSPFSSMTSHAFGTYDSLRWAHSNAREKLSEAYWLRVLVLIMLPVIAYSVFEQTVHPSWTPKNVGCFETDHESPEGTAIFLICIHLLVLSLFLGAIYHLRGVRDEFSIANELKTFVASSIVVTITLCVLLALWIKGVWDTDLYRGVYNYVEVCQVYAMYCVSVIHPLYRSYFPREPVSWPSLATLQSLDALLKDEFCVTFFYKYLVREFSIANLLLYMNIEFFRSSKSEDLFARAVDTYELFIKDGAPFEVDIPRALRDTVAANMARPNLHVFDAVQEHVLETMRRDSFPRFLQSDICKELVSELNSQETVRARLLRSRFM